MKDSGKILKKFLVVVTVIIILSGAGVFFIRRWIFSKMSADLKVRYNEWNSTPLYFNTADIESPPFQNATNRAAIKFGEEWERNKKPALEIANEFNKYIKGEDAGDTHTVSLHEELPEFDSLIQAFEQLIEKDDYEIDALIAGKDLKDCYVLPSPDYLQLQVSTKILGLKAIQLINDEKTSEASKMAETMIRASKSHLYSSLICQLISIACHSMGSQTWYYVLSHCGDPELLKSALIRQNELAPRKGFIAPDIDIMVSDNIGAIRMAQKFGIALDIEGKTGREIFGEWFRAEAEFQENIVLPLVSDPSEIARIQKSISGYRNPSAVFGAEPIGFKSMVYRLGSPIICPMLFIIATPNYEEARTREKVTLAKYDLLRLYTAKKLYFIEHKKEPEKMEDLVPAYIPELLIDLFTEKEPFRKESFFYSIGPDEKDQKGAILYDPTNGTTSSGDIFFPH